MQTIGVDLGARRVTGVLIDQPATPGASGTELVATTSRPTGSTGLSAVVAELVAAGDPARLSHVVLASDLVADLLADRRVQPVGAIRLCDPPRSAMPPYHGWPPDLAELLGAPGHLTTAGPEDLRAVAAAVAVRGRSVVAITGAFSGVSVAEERGASAAVRARMPTARVTLSHSLGPIGLLERENAAILNASLVPAITDVLDDWSESLARHGGTIADLPLHLVRHDATIADGDHLQEHPLLTIGARRAALARGCAIAAGSGQVLVGWPAEDGWGMEVLAVNDNLPQRSDRPRVVLGVPTSVPQLDVRRAAGIHRWERIAGDEHVLIREAAAVSGLAGPLIVVADGRARELPGRSGGGGRPDAGRRPRLVADDAAVLTALGAATGLIGGECERLARPGAEEAADEVESEARVRATAAGARFDTTRVLTRSSARVSYTASSQGSQWHRVVVRVVGDPVGRLRGDRP